MMGVGGQQCYVRLHGPLYLSYVLAQNHGVPPPSLDPPLDFKSRFVAFCMHEASDPLFLKR